MLKGLYDFYENILVLILKRPLVICKSKNVEFPEIAIGENWRMEEHEGDKDWLILYYDVHMDSPRIISHTYWLRKRHDVFHYHEWLIDDLELLDRSLNTHTRKVVSIWDWNHLLNNSSL